MPTETTPALPPEYGGADSSEPDWKAMALDCLHALRLMNAHYDDMIKSNPGFMGKLCLQRYDLWNKALLVSEGALRKYAHVPDTRAVRTDGPPRDGSTHQPIVGPDLSPQN